MHRVESTLKAQRRLAAILSADVEGYARLMNADEAGTLRLLTSYRDITDRLIAAQGGRIANTAGDSILAEFPSAVDALQCALDMLEKIAAVNREIPEERRVIFRMGLHVGEVMIRDGDLFGDGVNIAARMQAVAQPGSVCLSEAAHQFVHRALPLSFEDLGPQQVKNFDASIRAYLAHPTGDTPSPVLPPVHRRVVSHLARRLHDLCSNALTKVTGPEGFAPVEFAALASVQDAPGIDHHRLAERLAVEAGKAQEMLKRLEARALVQRIPAQDKQGPATFEATSAGESLLHALRPAIVAAHDRILAPLSDRERETLLDLLVRVIKANEAKNKAE